MQLLKQYNYSPGEIQNNKVVSKKENIIVSLLLVDLALAMYIAFRILVLGIFDTFTILGVLVSFNGFVILFQIFRVVSQKEKLLKCNLYIKTDEGYYIVETANYLKTIVPKSYPTESYETIVKNELEHSSADVIIRALKPGCDVKYLYRRGVFYKIDKLLDVEEKNNCYIIKVDCVKNGKRKISNKKFIIYKAYEELEDFISNIREL